MTVHRLEVTFSPLKQVDRRFILLAAGLTKRLASFWAAIQARRSVNQLLKWDDRMLRDIGVTRGDVVSAISGAISENPGARLSSLARERRLANEHRIAAMAGRRRQQSTQRG